MKQEKGITLTSLCVFLVVLTIVMGSLAVLTNFFNEHFSYMHNSGKNAGEFTKFNLAFLSDVQTSNIKVNSITNSQIEFSNGSKYTYKNEKIFRNGEVLANNVKQMSFTKEDKQVDNSTLTIVKISILVGDKYSFNKTIEYTLKNY